MDRQDYIVFYKRFDGKEGQVKINTYSKSMAISMFHKFYKGCTILRTSSKI